MFGFDNSSSSHSNNQNTDCLVLGEGPTYSINGSFVLSRKKVNNIFQTMRSNHTMIFLKLTDSYKISDIYMNHNKCPGHMLIT